MKKSLCALALLGSVMLFFTTCEKSIVMDPSATTTDVKINHDLKNGLVFCGDPVAYPLMAAKTIKSGFVEIGNDLFNLYVTFNTTEGWELAETHLYVGTKEGIPMTKKGNVIPGQFPYQMCFDPYVTSYTFVIPLESLSDFGECLTIAGHAKLTMLKGDVIINETAWLKGDYEFAKPNWGWYTEFCLKECIPDHIVVFRNYIPWEYETDPELTNDAQLDVFATLGITAGPGHMQFEILTSADMASVVLSPSIDLVIISNDQDQTFYDDYAANAMKFEAFINMGGHLLWEACDLGWHMGSMIAAGIVLPGAITLNPMYENFNFIPDPSLPLVAGIPSPMDHNFASHEYFTNLPAGSIIYCEGSVGPTLLETAIGSGWMMLTGQPLEHQYKFVYNNPDMEVLLPRIISHFTGAPLPPMFKAGKAIGGESIPSHIEK